MFTFYFNIGDFTNTTSITTADADVAAVAVSSAVTLLLLTIFLEGGGEGEGLSFSADISYSSSSSFCFLYLSMCLDSYCYKAFLFVLYVPLAERVTVFHYNKLQPTQSHIVILSFFTYIYAQRMCIK